jgi:hypothetical protein
MSIDVTVTPASAITVEMAQYGLRGLQGEVGSLNFNVVASEVIGGHRAVLADGYYAKADGTFSQALCVGISSGAVDIGATIDVQPNGYVLDMVGWNWNVGGLIYLGTAGGLTQTIPSAAGSFYVVLGVALSSTSMVINIQNPILL